MAYMWPMLELFVLRARDQSVQAVVVVATRRIWVCGQTQCDFFASTRDLTWTTRISLNTSKSNVLFSGSLSDISTEYAI
jgi:hypothetical protein